MNSNNSILYAFILAMLFFSKSALSQNKAKRAVQADKAHESINNGQYVRGQGMVIAVLDTGLNTMHPDMFGKIAFKNSDRPDGVDNDKNGLKDDYQGWNFLHNSGLLTDDNGHGTHVAATIVAEDYGIAPSASIVPIKVTVTPKGVVSDYNMIKAINYAADNGAKIINLSIRGYYPGIEGVSVAKLAIENAIKYAEQKNILIVVAAGNDHQVDITNTNIMPAGSDSPNVIVVCAVDDQNHLASFSNYSETKVDVCAPGVEIEAANGFYFQMFSPMGAYVDNGQSRTIPMNGTSMATPIVSGIAALVWSMDPTMPASQVKKIIMDSANRMRGKYPQLHGKSVTGSVVNANDAVWEYMIYHRSFWQ